MKPVRTYFPRTKLAEAIARSGGLTRDMALSEAQRGLENLRDECIDAIEESIADVEAIVHGAKGNTLADEQMNALLPHAERIFALAGTFEMDCLQMAARSLCDITEGLLALERRDVAPIAVHAQAIRLFAPKGEMPPQENTERVLAELAKVLAHFRIVPLAERVPEVSA